jgi:hypothetical protein
MTSDDPSGGPDKIANSGKMPEIKIPPPPSIPDGWFEREDAPLSKEPEIDLSEIENKINDMSHKEIVAELRKRGLDQYGKKLTPAKMAAAEKKEAKKMQRESVKKEREAEKMQRESVKKEKEAEKMQRESVKKEREAEKMQGEVDMDLIQIDFKEIWNQKISPAISLTARSGYYILITGLLVFSFGVYSLVAMENASASAKILSLSAIIFSFGILMFSMFITVKGIEDKEEKEWVRISLILGGIYTFNKFIDLYEPVSLFVEILNVFASFL